MKYENYVCIEKQENEIKVNFKNKFFFFAKFSQKAFFTFFLKLMKLMKTDFCLKYGKETNVIIFSAIF